MRSCCSRLRDAEMISRKIARTSGSARGPRLACATRASTAFSRAGAYTCELLCAFCSAIAIASAARRFSSRKSWSSIRSICRRSAGIEALRTIVLRLPHLEAQDARGGLGAWSNAGYAVLQLSSGIATRSCSSRVDSIATTRQRAAARPNVRRAIASANQKQTWVANLHGGKIRAEPPVPLVTRRDQPRRGHRGERRQVTLERATEQHRGSRWLTVRPPARLRDDLVDDAEAGELRGRQPEQLRAACDVLRCPLAEEDRGAALGRDHRVPGVLLHHDSVRDSEGERTAAAALADDGRDHGDRQRRERPQAHRDRLRLPALLRSDARVRALRVDEGQHRAREALRELEEPDRLPVALRPRHAEVARDALACGPPALLPHDDDRAPAEARHAADDRAVVADASIAVQLDELAAEHAPVVEHCGTVGMARELDPLPWREPGEQLLLHPPALCARTAQALAVARVGAGHAEASDLGVERLKRPLEVEVRRGRPAAPAAHAGGAAAVASAPARNTVAAAAIDPASRSG